jgi:hypothetical protein
VGKVQDNTMVLFLITPGAGTPASPSMDSNKGLPCTLLLDEPQ